MVLATKSARMWLTICVYIVYYTIDIFWRFKTTSGEMFKNWGYMVTFCESLTFFWRGGWIYITFMGLYHLKLALAHQKNLGKSSTPYGNCQDSESAWSTHPSSRIKNFPILHCWFYDWNKMNRMTRVWYLSSYLDWVSHQDFKNIAYVGFFQALCLCLCLCHCFCVLLWFLNSCHHKLSEYVWL